jgi:protein-L-isoaspartate(D-aspartate) O-methyltransferase
MVLSHLLQAADIAEHEHVLDVGCATGYTAAIVARLAGTVVALEEDRALAASARRLLGELAPQVKIVEGPLPAGWPEFGPYDVIVLEGATEVIPPTLFEQLKDGGRLVTIDGVRPGAKAAVYWSVKGEVSCRPLIEAAAPLLPGFAKPPAFVF